MSRRKQAKPRSSTDTIDANDMTNDMTNSMTPSPGTKETVNSLEPKSESSVKLAEIKNEMVSPKVTEVAKIEEKRCSPVYKEVVAITPKKRKRVHLEREEKEKVIENNKGVQPNSDNLFVCEVCSLMFSCYRWLQRHQREDRCQRPPCAMVAPLVAAVDTEVVICSQCDFKSDCIYTLGSHIKSVHGFESSNSGGDDPPPIIIVAPTRPVSAVVYNNNPSVTPPMGDGGGGGGGVVVKMEVDLNDEGLGVNEYRCTCCDEAYRSLDDMQRHLVNTHIDLIYRCSICKLYLESEDDVQKHLFDNHINQSSISKQSCDRISDEAFLSKMDQESENIGSDAAAMSAIGGMQKKLLERNGMNWKCEICDRCFETLTILSQHKITQHTINERKRIKKARRELTNQKTETSEGPPVTPTAPTTPTIRCKNCGDRLDTTESYFSHVRIHTPQIKEGNKDIRCVVCSENIHSAVELQNHAELHVTMLIDSPPDNSATKTPSLPQFQCIKCQQTFDTEQAIKEHVVIHVKSEGNIHKCMLCQQEFVSPAKLQCHLILHSFQGDPKMMCHSCGMTFTDPEEIQAHVLRHGLTSRHYKCPKCPQCFSFSAEFNNHFYAMHEPTDFLQAPLRTALAPPGGRIGGTNAALIGHMSSSLLGHAHGIPEAVISPKRILSVSPSPINKQTLNCTICDLKFMSDSDLKYHLQTHLNSASSSRMNMHACHHCGQLFAHCAYLQRHLAKEHNVVD